jgi:hypothetical protein
MARYIDANSTWNVNLTHAQIVLPTTVRSFLISQPTHLTIHGHMGLQHRGNYYRADGSVCDVGWGVKFFIKGPCATEAGLAAAVERHIIGAIDAGNLSMRSHYATAALNGHLLIEEEGYYQVYAKGNWHGSTDGVPQYPATTASSVEVNAMAGASMYNCLYYRLEEAA